MSGRQPAGLTTLVLACLLLALVLVVPLQAQEGGIIEGRVVNGTPGGPPVGTGVPVTLHVLRNGSEVETRETTTTAGGSFRFDGLDPDPDLGYWLEAVYLDVPYSSAAPVEFAGQAQAAATTINVYEVSDDDSGVRLHSVHVIAESFGQVVRISEIHMFSNDSDRTFAGNGEGPSPDASVFIPLPAGAVGLAFSDEDPAGRYVEADDGVWDTEPVAPGEDTSLVFLSYHLMVGDEPITVVRTFAYPVDAFNILVTQPGLTLQSEQLVDEGLQSFQGRDYAFYVAEDLAVGAELVMDLTVDEAAAAGSGMPGTESPSVPAPTVPAEEGQQGLLRILGFVLAGFAVVAAVAYPQLRKRRAGVPSDVASRPGLPEGLTPEQRRLIEELADLEDARQEGRVDKAGYEQRRAQIYEALRSY